ncbi:hypothetical protein M2138_001024 [Dysgonomonadaceae bacterium PH5-43]|nr:hypothetical protein [Dysgonomonadaceae bacterium PH5-43]
MKTKLLTLLMCLAVAVSSFAQSGTTGNLTWTFNEETGELKIEGKGKMPNYDYYDDQNQTPWHDYLSSIKSISIGDEITTIGGFAFYYCQSLQSISIPNSVTSIGFDAFSYCESLTSISIPNSVTTIGNYAFYKCSSLKEVKVFWATPLDITEDVFVLTFSPCALLIPAGTKSLYEKAVGWKEFGAIVESGTTGNLTWTLNWTTGELKIEGKGEMPDYDDGSPWSDYRSSIKSISIGNGITTIGDNAFSKCLALSSITIPNSVTTIGASAFLTCVALSSITLPNSVTSIGENAFLTCLSLKSITIPNSVTSIGGSAFRSCSSLKGITLPNSVTSIGVSAFEGCRSLANITLPDSLISIGGGAFSGCESLTSITIPNSVTTIGVSAFYRCSSLESITLPNSVTTIGENTFFYCGSLANITLPNSVTSIGWGAFYGCSSLKGITLPDSVTTIGDYAFSRCASLAAIDVKEGNAKYSSTDGILFNKDKTELVRYPAGKSATSYAIPSTVISIADDAFGNCEKLNSIQVSDNVVRIGNNAFSYCDSLTNIILPNSVTTIGVKAFLSCNSLLSITLPANVTSIGDYAFTECNSLKEMKVFWATPLDVKEEVFGFPFEDCTLSVPAGTKSLYENADVWKNFGTIVERDETNIDNLETSNNIYISGNTLYICTPVSETITVYSVTGELLYTFAKPAGEVSFILNNTKHQMLIVRTESGVTKKLINI